MAGARLPPPVPEKRRSICFPDIGVDGDRPMVSSFRFRVRNAPRHLAPAVAFALARMRAMKGFVRKLPSTCQSASSSAGDISSSSAWVACSIGAIACLSFSTSLRPFAVREIIERRGGKEGTRSAIAFDPMRGRGVVVLANARTDDEPGDLAMHLLTGKALVPTPRAPLLPETTATSPRVLATYAGR
jgi:hypothetical protein